MQLFAKLLWTCSNCNTFSFLTLLVGRQEGHSACKKSEWRGADVVICLERGADLHMAQLMPLPLTCFSKIQIGFIFLVPACPSSLGINGRYKCVCMLFELLTLIFLAGPHHHHHHHRHCSLLKVDAQLLTRYE